MRKQVTGWLIALIALVAVATVACPADPAAAEELAPAEYLTSETVDLGSGYGQTLWRDAQGTPYDLGLIFPLPRAVADAVAHTTAYASGGDVPGMIWAAARRYGLDAERMRRIAFCESKYQPGATSRGGHRGIFQFDAQTWQGRAPLAGVSPDFAVAYDAGANVAVAAATMARGEWSRWACK